MLHRWLLSLMVSLVALTLPACAASPDAGSEDPTQIPKPTYGVQLPTPTFEVPDGKEVQRCFWFKLPSDVDLDITRVEVRYLQGSHHMNLFQTDQDMPDHEGDCFTGVFSPMGTNGYQLIVGSQLESLDWKLPDGVAIKLKARRQLMLQSHYVNAGSQKSPRNEGKVVVNLHAEPDRTKVKHALGTMFANNVNVLIPPRQSRSFTTSCVLPKETTLVALTGHFHSRGKAFSVNLKPDAATATDEVYRSRDWDEPPFTVLDNPMTIPAGGGLQYTCDFQNISNTAVKFGPHVETDEHCNLFAYYYPALPEDPGGTHYCF